jgi:hypothetical protein
MRRKNKGRKFSVAPILEDILEMFVVLPIARSRLNFAITGNQVRLRKEPEALFLDHRWQHLGLIGDTRAGLRLAILAQPKTRMS